MIRLHKGPVPDVLQAKAAEWTQEYLDAKAGRIAMTDTVRFRYRHEDIKAALREESFDKCIYCESKVGFGETDHINPVSRRPDQVVDWVNLGLACKECNTFKGDYHAPAEPLVNPFTDEPADHLFILGPMIVHVPGDDKGLRTRSHLKLNRPDLFQKRQLRIDRLAPLADQWMAHGAGKTKDLLRQALLDEATDAAEYAATVRGYLAHALGWNMDAD